MPENDEDFELGELRLTVHAKSGDRTVTKFGVDRLAVDRLGLLYLLSVVGPQGSVKGLRAVLNAKVPADFELKRVHCTDGQDGSGFASRFHTKEGQKFAVRSHPLPFGQVHALFSTLEPGFLKVASDDALFAALKQPEYTTPILRSWVGALRATLIGRALLTPLFGFRCQCSLLTAKDTDLDAAVTLGIQSGTLLFRELNLVGEA